MKHNIISLQKDLDNAKDTAIVLRADGWCSTAEWFEDEAAHIQQLIDSARNTDGSIKPV